jgi:radical SAM protein with 4Fe4S-binding SPASM domain
VLQHKEADTLFSVTREQMDHLEQFVTEKVIAMADKLSAGEIAPQPCRLDAPCKYCDYADLCGKCETADAKNLKKEEKTAALFEVFGSPQKEDDDNA